MDTPPSSATVALYAQRPFFEKALRYGTAHGILGPAKIDAIRQEGAKGIVQIARYFGTEFLRPELELARQRMVNLVSLYLEHSTQGDLHAAAESLRAHSLLSRSKGGADMLKALLLMPDHSHFGMSDSSADKHFSDDQIPLLARWTLRSLDDYRAELALRRAVQQQREAAFWFARRLGLPAEDLLDAATDAEAVIRTGLLMGAAGAAQMPNWAQFEQAVLRLRKRPASATPPLRLPDDLPPTYHAPVQALATAMLRDDWPRLLDPALAPRKLLQQSLALMGKYFWRDGGIDDISDFDHAVSAEWTQLTQQHSDDSSLLTLFLCLSAKLPPKARTTSLSASAAASLVRRLRKNGFDPEPVRSFINEHAPHEHHNNYQQLWQQFVDEAERDLLDERDTSLAEALRCLRLHCNIVDVAKSA